MLEPFVVTMVTIMEGSIGGKDGVKGVHQMLPGRSCLSTDHLLDSYC